MEDFIMVIGIAVAVIYFIIVIVKAILFMFWMLLGGIATGIIGIAEWVMGGWTGLHPAINWAVASFVVGVLLHFGILESNRLKRENLRYVFITLSIIFLLITSSIKAIAK